MWKKQFHARDTFSIRGGATSQPTITMASKSKDSSFSKYNIQSTLESINTLASSPATKLQNAVPHLLCESALMDKETNRIYWQGGSEILSTSLTKPYLTQRGVVRVRASILFTIIWLWVWGKFSRYLTTRHFEKSSSSQGQRLFIIALPFIEPLGSRIFGEEAPYILKKVGTIVLSVIQFVMLLVHSLLYLRLPPYSPRIIVTSILLYLFEAYNCSTRRYLSHAKNAPQEIQSYLEQLRGVEPVVKWKVRCFHYEDREFVKNFQGLFRLWENSNNNGSAVVSESGVDLQNRVQGDEINSGDQTASKFGSTPPYWMARKVVTHEAVGTYKFKSWEDHTLATLWKRSQSFSTSHEAPFTKLALSKLLVLKDQKAREDYFAQQAAFVTMEGRKDVFAEFATNIEVEGFRPRLLAVRPVRHAPTSAALFRLHVYILFTLLGLSLPYRIWFARHCDEIRVTVVKETSDSSESNDDEDASNGKSSWFRRGWGWGSSPSSEAMESKRAQELFRKSMQSFSLYEEEPTSFDLNVKDEYVSQPENTSPLNASVESFANSHNADEMRNEQKKHATTEHSGDGVVRNVLDVTRDSVTDNNNVDAIGVSNANQPLQSTYSSKGQENFDEMDKNDN